MTASSPKRTLFHLTYLPGIKALAPPGRALPPHGRARWLGVPVEVLGKCLSYKVPKSGLRRAIPRSGAALWCVLFEQQLCPHN
jgi:hypothetical protein